MCYEYGICDDCAEDHALYKVGQQVEYRGSFGRGKIERVVIEGIGSKNGEVVYDLDNDHWCYESQILSNSTDKQLRRKS